MDYNVLLINPYTGLVRKKANVPPIRVAYEGGYLLEHGFPVNILDMKLHKLKYLTDFLNDADIDLLLIHIGLSFTNLSGSCYPFTLQILESLKDFKRDLTVGLIGEHPMLLQEKLTLETLVHDTADFLLYGEEDILPKIVTNLNRKERPEALRDIPAVIFKENSNWKKNPPAQFIQNLDNLPQPAFNLMEMNNYRFHILWTSRGCPFDCSFCSTNIIYNKQYRSMSPERIVNDMEHILNEYGERVFWIVDDLFTYSKERVHTICDTIIERNLDVQWCVTAGSRAQNLDEILLQKMKQAGCDQIGFGVESGNDEVLHGLNKGFTLDDVRKNARMVQQAGIPIQFYFMIGNPGDTLQTIEDTFNFIWEIRPDNIIFFPAVPYPGSKFYNWVQQNGRILRESYGDLFTHEDYKIPEPYFEVHNFTRNDQIIAMRRALALKVARYNLPRLFYVMLAYLRQNRLKYFSDILLMMKNWLRLRFQ
jgi:radical SAM superfamily enzyme YgiQ (UPF0313 family)